jgi:hypothetical protein
MENIVFEGAAAAVARINLDNAPSATMLEKIRSESTDVIELNLIQLAGK